MSSQVLQTLPIDNKWVNLAFQEVIKRFPVNIRPVFQVQKQQSFKGSALFSMANLLTYELSGEEMYRDDARTLLNWLLQHKSEGYTGFCGGHQHPRQDLLDRKESGMPDVVSTGYGTLALLQGVMLDERYAKSARSVANFIIDDLEYRKTDSGARVKYNPDDGEEVFVLNANAIAARVLLELHAQFPQLGLRRKAENILDYVVARQTGLGGWKYMDPPSYSHLSMDNHHNGFIIESLIRHHEITESDRYIESLGRAYNFYRHNLFESNGAPNWDEKKAYPKDIHASAQGIIVFSLGGSHEFAQQILQWTIDNLYAGEGQFYYQKRRLYTKKFTLMRWCQAWMAYAIAIFLKTHPDISNIVVN